MPTSIGIAIVVAAGALLLGSVAFIQSELARSHPAAVEALTPQEIATREAMLREARVMYDAGMYDASASRYRAYLDTYPWSDAAREGEMMALDALAKQKEEEIARAQRQREELVRKRPTRRAPPIQASQPPASVETVQTAPETPPQPKPSIWRRIFRRPEPPPAPPASTPPTR